MEALNHFRDATDILDACENGTDSILDDVRRLASRLETFKAAVSHIQGTHLDTVLRNHS